MRPPAFRASRASGRGESLSWDEVRIELIGEPVEVQDGLLIAENVAHLRGRDGIEVQARSAWLITIRDDKQTSLTLY